MSNRIDARRLQPYEGPIAGTQPDPSADRGDRSARAAARDRFDAFAADPGGDATDPSADLGCPNGDYDRCVDRTVPHAALWIAQGTDADPIDRADVRQSQLGDCNLLAVLAGLAMTAEGRALLRGAIVENTNATGQVLSYTVTLHQPERRGLFGTAFSVRKVDVPPVYARGHAQARPAGDRNEVWTLVMESAFAKFEGGYDAIGHGGDIADAMEIVTGRPAQIFGLGLLFGRYGPDDLRHDLIAHHVVAVASRTDVEQTRPDLVPHHAYVVTGIEQSGGKTALSLWNPWGYVQPAPVPFDDLRSLFSQVVVGTAR